MTAAEKELVEASRFQAVPVFIYAAMCGTCRMAQRYVDLVEEASSYSIRRVDITELPGKAAGWQVESVPCLAVISNGEITAKKYAMNSVTSMFSFLKEELT
ncbi:thioredoxin family protein [Alkalicoccus urumqiensis]|uniref:thioredoxin family protein n=1 Tax=Alkalicoccus urumqiensis TaxID=1548213 RepID=UPI0015E5A8E3|nr:thioredoxin family protein [Alkalicoccus urumqiensis]